MMTSAADTPSSAWIPVGMPRPLSSTDTEPSKWTVKDGAMECVPGSGYVRTLQAFGDCQLHIEFATPTAVKGTGQGRGNSGVFLMTNYDIQVLDSYENKTYFDGQCGSVYKQHPPLVNACRKPGEWQTYDIVFESPRFEADGKLARPGYVTVLHNGVVVQNHFELKGETLYIGTPQYRKYDSAPIKLQAHGDPSPPVSFRNIWLRELK